MPGPDREPVHRQRRRDYPIAPVAVGLILVRRRRPSSPALQIGRGDAVAVVQSPLAVVLFPLAAIALLASFVLRGLARFRSAED